MILATAARDSFLVATDEALTVAVGTHQRVESAACRRRRWCAAEELVVVGGPEWPGRRRVRDRRRTRRG